MVDVEKKIKGKQALITSIHKIFNGVIKKIYIDYKEVENDLDTLISSKEVILSKLVKLNEIDEEIYYMLLQNEDYDNLQTQSDESVDINIDIKKKVKELERFISKCSNIENSDTVSTTSVSRNTTVKLPKINIKNFHGDPTEWTSFWDCFEAAIHKNEHLSDVERMNYLRNYLRGEAEVTIKGLRLTNDNYLIALNLLKDRYADPQILISAHMNELLNFQVIGDINNVKELRQLFDKVETQVRSLDNLGVECKSYGPMLVPVLMSKLPAELKLIISRKFGKTLWDIQTIVKEFKNELEVRERITLTDLEEGNEHFPHTGQSLFSGASKYHQATSRHFQQHKKPPGKPQQFSKFTCVFCDSNSHKPQDCTVVTNPFARKDVLKSKGNCFICMKSGHQARGCQSQIKCFKCRRNHHVAICFSTSYEPPSNYSERSENKFRYQKQSTEKPQDGYQANVSNSTGVELFKNKSVLLQTARAQVSSVDERKSKNMRILFDSGSQLSYISPRARDSLDLKTNFTRDISIKVFGKSQTRKTLDGVKFAVKSRDGNLNIYVDAFVNQVCYPIEGQKLKLVTSTFPHLQGLELADSNPENLPLDVDILIGGDYYWQFFNSQIIKGETGPAAMSSKLGFVLSGPVEPRGSDSEVTHSNIVNTTVLKVQSEFISEIEKTKHSLKSIWDSEIHPIDKSIIDNFEENIKFKNGRYEVGLPFKETHDALQDHYFTSVNRLKNLTMRSFKGNPQLLNEYDRIINEQRNLEIIETVPTDTYTRFTPSSVNYLPHRPVIRNDKSTTKVRMVFDASAKGKGPSLNDCLYPGPSLTPSLYGVLLRFRANNIAVVGDIEKAFLQIGLQPEDRDFVRFLWFRDINNIDFDIFENNDLVEYRLSRVLFGCSSSPFLLSATLIHHINQYRCDDSSLVEKLLNSLHVDDLSSGCDDVDSGLKFYLKCKETLKDGSFNLRKFKSNSRKLEDMVRNLFPDDENSNLEEMDDNFREKVLGILWDRNSDEFIFNFDEVLAKVSSEPTKRNVLQVIASIYDPLGIINPIVVEMKILFQDICSSNLKWDEPLSGNILERWNTISNELKNACAISINRVYCYKEKNDPFVKTEIHGFCDASKRANGCCIYIRFTKRSGRVVVKLLTARSRVNSTRNYSIPRVELCGAVLLFQVLAQVIDEIAKVFKINDIFAWTDSSVVFSWIKNTDKTYETFVQNRIKQIRTIQEQLNKKLKTTEVNLKLINSKENPADIISRGMKPSLLQNSVLWFNGPEFLMLPEDKWPEFEVGDNFTPQEEKMFSVQLGSGSTRLSDATTFKKSESEVCNVYAITPKETESEVVDLCEKCLSDAHTLNNNSENRSVINYAQREECLSDISSMSEFVHQVGDNTVIKSNTRLSDVTSNINKDKLLLSDGTCLSSAITSINDVASISAVIDVNNYSSLSKLLRVTAYVLRFISNVRKKRLNAEETGVNITNKNRVLPEEMYGGVLSTKEIMDSKFIWIKNIQNAMEKQGKFSQIEQSLKLFKDDQGVLRCGGRLSNAPIPYCTKFPILLPSNSNFTNLIIHQAHVLVGHSLCRNTLTQVRQEYWIPKGRQTVKKVIKDCRRCRRFDNKTLKYPSPPDLPEIRLRNKHAFDAIGIDYAGPVYVRNIYGDSRDMYKAWIGLITCASSRAVYLDLVPDSSSEECIELLKRFISRYGAPSNVISDNGKCFISEETQNFVSNKNIIWKFNLESAPWQGGFFERMVQSVKRCLRKTLVNARLNFLQMLTLLLKIELIINNRPLTYLSNELDELPITPNNLIYGRILNQVANSTKNCKNEKSNDENIEENVIYVNKLLEHFWNRWKAEYVTELREHHRVINKGHNDQQLKVNDIVLVVHNKQPRYMWRIGRVEELITGKDGKARGAKVLTKTDQGQFSSLRRPVNQLVLLELSEDLKENIDIPVIRFINDKDIQMNT